MPTVRSAGLLVLLVAGLLVGGYFIGFGGGSDDARKAADRLCGSASHTRSQCGGRSAMSRAATLAYPGSTVRSDRAANRIDRRHVRRGYSYWNLDRRSYLRFRARRLVLEHVLPPGATSVIAELLTAPTG